MSRSDRHKAVEKAERETERLFGRAIREGHYLLDGQFVHVSVVFYPKLQWWICDAHWQRGDIKGTERKLDPDTAKRLENWL